MIRWPVADHFDLPSALQFPLAYNWHYGPAWEDAFALEARAEDVEAEREAIELRLVAADECGDTDSYERAEHDHALACRELSLLLRRIEELE